MKIRITGTDAERAQVMDLLKSLPITEVSKLYPADDLREMSVYLTVTGQNQGGPLEDWRVIEFCNSTRSKADVMRFFNISFESAEEILTRLADSGALLRWVYDKKYVYLDARWAKFVKPKCGDCEHRDGWGDCTFTHAYAKVNEKCSKFEPALSAFWGIKTPENYAKLLEGEHEQN